MTAAAEDAEFFRWYGPWAALDPAGVAEFMAGFARPWWIVGGWSIEAFTGVAREHEDVDLSILACDISAFREHMGDRWNLWCNQGGMLRPLNDRFPEVLADDCQIWIREHALAPWLIDLPITPDRDGLWTSKRWAEHVAPVEEVTWVAETGIRYVNPEIAPCTTRRGSTGPRTTLTSPPPGRSSPPGSGLGCWTPCEPPSRVIPGSRCSPGHEEPRGSRGRPSRMTPRRLALVVPLTLLLALAGCRGDDTPVAKDPAPTASPMSTTSTGPAVPHWPDEGCDTHSGMNVDYVSDAVGADTLDEALAPYVPDGATVVKKEAKPHRNAQYLVVDEDNEIVAAVEAFDGDNGWLVDFVEKCSG